MGTKEAREYLTRATLDSDGIFTRLRLGRRVEAESARMLGEVLRQLWREFRSNDWVPRDVAYSCAIILNYADECISNIQDNQDESVCGRRDLEDMVRSISQRAFEVLAGLPAEEWIVPNQA